MQRKDVAILGLAVLVGLVWGGVIGPEVSLTHGGVGLGVYVTEGRFILSVFVP